MRNSTITPMGIYAVALGSIIGFGSFLLPGDYFLPQSGVLNTLIALFAGLLLVVIVEKNYKVMLNKYSALGGEFSYTYAELGLFHAFLCGWLLSIAYFSLAPLNAGAVVILFREFFPELLKGSHVSTIAGYDVFLGDIVMISALIILFTWINILGVRFAQVVQITLVITMIIGLIVAGTMVFTSRRMTMENLNAYLDLKTISLTGILPVLAIVPWAYIGFDTIVQLSSEFSFSAKKASKLTILALVSGFFFYNATNIIAAVSYGPDTVANNNQINWAVGSSVRSVGGNIASTFIVASMLGALICGINGFMLAGSRLICAIAQAKLLPSFLGNVDSKRQTPRNALIFVCILSLITPWFGRKILVWIVDMSSTGAAIAYIYVSIGALKIAQRGKDRRVFLYALCGVAIGVFFLLTLFSAFLVNTAGLIFLRPLIVGGMGNPSLVSLVIWFLLGMVLYFSNIRKALKIPKRELRKILLDE